MCSESGKPAYLRSFLPLLVALLVVFIHAPSAYAQASRKFQMVLYGNPGVPPTPAPDADLGFFEVGQPQSAGRGIMRLGFFPETTSTSEFQSRFTDLVQSYNFSRVEAFYIDEPYWTILNPDPNVPADYTNPCVSGGARLAEVEAIRGRLAFVSQLVKGYAPWAKFWVNFSEPEVQWLRGLTASAPDATWLTAGCAVALNHMTFDVVSIDKYLMEVNETNPAYSSVPSIANQLDWLLAHPAKSLQQIALVPGTFWTPIYGAASTEQVQAARLQGFFDYANTKNADCSRGNCPVWVVAGFQRGDENGWIGEANAPAIGDVWRGELSKPVSYAPLTVTTPTANVSFPSLSNSPITWTVQGSGGFGPLQYQFRFSSATGWTMNTVYGPSNSWTFTPQTAGTYAVSVWVRDAGSSEDYQAYTSNQTFTVVSPIVINSVTRSALSVTAGNSITFTVSSSGGSGVTQYQYWINEFGTWTYKAGYTSGNTYTFVPMAPGNYGIRVYAKNADAQVPEVVSPDQYFNVWPIPVSVTQNVPSPVALGTPITWTIQPSTSTVTLQYQYWISDGVTWYSMTPYTTTNTFTFNPWASGTYALRVYARIVGSTVSWEAVSSYPFTVSGS
jgi:hypothetical protein